MMYFLMLLLTMPSTAEFKADPAPPQPPRILLPDITLYVCDTAPVTLAEVEAAVGVWNYPTPIHVKPAKRKQCEREPEVGEFLIDVLTLVDEYSLTGHLGRLAGVTMFEATPLLNNTYLTTRGRVLISPMAVESEWVLIHEIGHVTGRGHSPFEKDVMYWQVNDRVQYVEPWTQAEHEALWDLATTL